MSPSEARASSRRALPVMGTIVSIEVVLERDTPTARADAEAVIDRAFSWCLDVEAACSRFEARSELRHVCAAPAGHPVHVSPLLFEPLQFALAVAEASDGAFDPTLGWPMEARGFNREHRTQQIVETRQASPSDVSYRDVGLDVSARTVTLKRPLLLDLGAVAKGLAVDLAARVLAVYRDFAIDAGGDLYLGGVGPAGRPWRVGLRHPRQDGAVFETVEVSDAAVCTSGDYERPSPTGDGHHILDPRTGQSSQAVASATVIAPTAMVADACATAAFVLGPEQGVAFLERQQVEGVIMTPTLTRHATAGFHSVVVP